MIKVKSIYSKALKEDGHRILVELFWPEGLKTREAKVHEWLKELGPSYDLQRFHLNHNEWPGYQARFEKEVLGSKEKMSLLEKIYQRSRDEMVTLLYANKNEKQNHALALKNFIDNHFAGNGDR